MPRNPAWKVAELKFARFLGGNRTPSQGVSNEDMQGEWFTGEHKFGKFDGYPAFFKNIIRQMDDNRQRQREKVSLGGITFHYGRGIRNRTFLLVEVDINTDGKVLEEALRKVAI